MKPIRTSVVFLLVLLVTSAILSARSGPLGFYGIVERVVFEPNQAAPERVQVWGAFSYVNGTPGGREFGTSSAQRGYLYFKLPEVAPGTASTVDYAGLAKREWADLAAVAGTGQAVGFGQWTYSGAYEFTSTFEPAAFERVIANGATPGLRVRPASEPPTTPALYWTNAGIVRLSATGNHAELVAQLKAALRK